MSILETEKFNGLPLVLLLVPQEHPQLSTMKDRWLVITSDYYRNRLEISEPH